MKALRAFLLVSVSVLASCAVKPAPLDNNWGLNVAPENKAKFDQDESACANEATLRGYPSGEDISTLTSRNVHIRSCLLNRGWKVQPKTESAAPTAAPAPPPASSATPAPTPMPTPARPAPGVKSGVDI